MRASFSGYYDHFPPKSWNVRVQDKDGKKVLVADKDFEKGDVIYKVSAVMALSAPPNCFAGIPYRRCFGLGLA